MRWILATTAVVAFAAWTVPGAAWAEDEPGKVRVAQEEYMLVLEGLEGEQLEACAAALRQNHPGVEVKLREGVLHVRGKDASSFERAMAALREMGVPAEGIETRKFMDIRKFMDVTEEQARAEKAEKRKGKPKGEAFSNGKEKFARAKEGMGPDAPSDADFVAKIKALEEKREALREAGRERDVAEVEAMLDRVRAMRGEVAAARAEKDDKPAKGAKPDDPRLDELRQRFEEAKRALHLGAHQRDGVQRQRLEGERAELEVRAGSGGPSELRQRMEHTRQALRHLKAAGLPEQAAHVERALHRMEMAAQGGAREPGEIRVIEVVPARRMGATPASPPMPAPMPPPSPQADLSPPPNVGGVNRGPIRHRKPAPRVMAPPVPPQPPAARFEPPGGMIVVRETNSGPDDVRIRRMEVGPGLRVKPPQGQQPNLPLLRKDPFGGRAPGAPAAPPSGAAAELEQVRRELDQLRKQLHDLARHLEQQRAPR